MNKQKIINFLLEVNESKKSPTEIIDLAVTVCLRLLDTNDKQEQFREIIKVGSIIDIFSFGCQISPNYLALLVEEINE